MAQEKSGWDTWLDITSKDPWRGMKIMANITAEATVETLSELGEAVVKVGVVLPMIAISKAAKVAKVGGGAIVSSGLRQFKGLLPEKNEEIEAAQRREHLEQLTAGEWLSGARTPSMDKSVDELFQ